MFYQLAAILVMAGLIGFVAVQCRQPLIIAFILTGLLAGPDVLHIIGTQDSPVIETLAQFGIALLLFMVGLKLDIRLIRQTGAVTLATGGLQVSLTFVFGFLLALALGFELVISCFIGLALSFSSTIIVVKMLSDKRVIDSLYGRISLGILIVQDLAVILITVLVTMLLGGGEEGAAGGVGTLFMIPLKALALIIATGVFIRYIANPLTKILARNSELMLIFCIAFAIFMAALCDTIHFSKELGGLLAGIALASTPYNNIIAARLAALRDFLLLFFFVNLGAHMSLTGIGEQLLPALMFSAFVLFGKPLLIMVVMYMMRYRKRTGFMTGLTLSQISEFSLILMAMGLSAGLVDQSALNLITLVGLITMGVSTYAIAHSSGIFNYLENHTALFRRGKGHDYQEEKQHEEMHKDYDVIIFGLGRYGSALARLFQKRGHDVLAVDFDPEAIENAQEIGISAVYGDAADPEFLTHLPLDKTQVIIFSFHHYMTGPLITDLRRTLAKALRERGYKGHIAATSHHPEQDKDLPEHGIDIVMGPFEDAAFHGMEQIMSSLDKDAA